MSRKRKRKNRISNKIVYNSGLWFYLCDMVGIESDSTPLALRHALQGREHLIIEAVAKYPYFYNLIVNPSKKVKMMYLLSGGL